MGEVHVTAKLTNAIDEGIARRGQLDLSKVRSREVEALIDTGAVNCVLPPFIADSLGLARPFKQVAQYADGRQEAVEVTEPILLEILGRRVYEECLVLGDDVLIGQTALESTDLLVDCRENRLIPNPAHPNQPVIRIRELRIPNQTR